MNTAVRLNDRQGQGKQLTNAKRAVLIGKLYDLLTQGHTTTLALSKELNVSRKTIDAYRPLVDDLITKHKLDRTVIRNLELQRAYVIVEKLMEDLKRADDRFDKDDVHQVLKTKTLIYNQIAKHSSRIALITGLNIETQVNVDQRQLVIIRADNHRKPVVAFADDKANISTLQPAAPQKASK